MNDIQYGQQSFGFMFSTGDITVASGATTTLTIQQPTTQKRLFRMWRAVVQLAANSGEVTQSQNGTDATGTAIPAATVASAPGYTALNPQQPGFTTPTTLGFSSSDVGAGTSIGNVVTVPAGGAPLVFDLTPMYLPQNSPNVNYSMTVKNTGGTDDTVRISIQGYEE